MTSTRKSLVAFDEIANVSKVTIQAHVEKIKSNLRIQFVGDDPDKLIVLPRKENIFQRAQELWRETCFECFFGEKGKKNYWELNLDHCGNWNLYTFENYRQPQPPQEEKRVKVLELEFLRKNSGFEVQCDLDLRDLGLEQKSLDVSLNCVIQWSNDETSYFALKHGANKPDFHLREAFVCNLE